MDEIRPFYDLYGFFCKILIQGGLVGVFHLEAKKIYDVLFCVYTFFYQARPSPGYSSVSRLS